MNHFVRVLIFVAVLAPVSSPAAVHDLRADWSDSFNPNLPWTYLGGANPLPFVADWTPLGSSATQPAWAPSSTFGNTLPAWMRATTDGPGGIDVLEEDIFVHASDPFNGSDNTPAAVQWTAPSDGTIDISGAIWLARDIGRASNWSISAAGFPVTDGSVSSGDIYDRSSPMNFTEGTAGAGPLTGIAVTAGQTVSLQVIRASSSGEFTGVEMTIDHTPDAVGIGDTPAPSAGLYVSPNPFRSTTTIGFELSASSPVLLEVFSIDGRRVSTLVNDRLASGHHRVQWNGRDHRGNPVASGIYLVRLSREGTAEGRRILLLD